MPSPEVRHARLLKPFPVKRLNDRVLYQLLSQAADIGHEAQRLLINPPTTPEPWCEALTSIGTKIETLADLCDDAAPLVELMMDSADGDFQRAVDAMAAMMRGMAESPPDGVVEAPAQQAA